jgi:ligand-binding SRPBCC domain-containing protein
MATFELQTTIAASREACLDLSLSVDAHTASMASSGERAIGGITQGLMQQGDTVTWRARHFGYPFTMTSHIADLVRPIRFVDEQIRGPFKSWWHEHIFHTTSEGKTLMIDRVEFRAPLGFVGRAVEWIALDRYMAHLIEVRNEWLKTTLESAGPEMTTQERE